jgi:F0F1-type ATP synthase beta subunit
MPSIKSTNEVSLTLNKPFFENAGAAQAMLDSSMETLQKGITREHKGVKVTFQADIVPIEGVGDKAAWAASLHQLSVADGRRMFHLTVNTGADAEQELGKAKAMAKQLAEIL